MGLKAGARRVVGRKEARKAERKDRKASRSRVTQKWQHSRPVQREGIEATRKQEQEHEAIGKVPIAVINKGKGKKDGRSRDVDKVEHKPMERGQRKHVAEDESTPLQRLMARQTGSSRRDDEPLKKKRRKIPLSKVEQEEEDEIAWLEAHIGQRDAGKARGPKKMATKEDDFEESEGIEGGEDGLDDLLDDLNRFYPGMYDEQDLSEAESSKQSDNSDAEEEKEEEEEDLDDESNYSGMSELSNNSNIKNEDLDEEEESSDLEKVRTNASETKRNEISAPEKVEGENSTGRYIPPALRRKVAAASSSNDSEEMQKLRRQVKGLLNRLGEGNIESIVMEIIESLYRQYSRANVTETLTTLIIQTITSSSNLVDTFVILYAALVASLHRLVGLEFGAHFLQTIVETWQTHYEGAQSKASGKESDEVEDVGKEAKNSILLIANLYNLGVVACPLIFDIVKVTLGMKNGDQVARPMTEVDVELLLRIVKTSGSQLRHDDPTSLKTIVQLAQQSSALTESKHMMSSRSRFMLEALEELKNNKVKASANQGLDQQSINRMKKYLAGLSRKRIIRTQEPLRVSLEDLQNVDKRGKWWLVGAAWAGYELNKKAAISEPNDGWNNVGQSRKVKTKVENDETKRRGLVEVARQHGMNTAIRQDIFIILISSQDYLDAMEKLQMLKFKKESQRREVIRVLLHCIGSEVNYNPYYVILASRLALDDFGTRFTLQYCLWDFLRDLGEKGVGGRSIVEREEEEEDQRGDDDDYFQEKTVSRSKISNIARAYGWWFAKGALSLSAMKVIDFTSLKAQAIQFLQEVFIHLLLSAHTNSPMLTLCLASTKKSGPFPKIGEIDQAAKESIESCLAKGTLSNKLLSQGLLFF